MTTEDVTTAPVQDPTREAMTEQSARVRAKQTAERRAEKVVAEAPLPPKATGKPVTKPAAKPAAAKPAKVASVKVTSAKAEPAEIRAFLDGLGLSNKQAAKALGKSVALIATVRNDKGDRWSAERWTAAKPIFQAYAKRHKVAPPTK